MWNDRKLDDRKVELNKVNKMGVFTNYTFRRAMIEMIVRALRDGEIEVSSPFFVKEMQSLEGDEFEQSLRAGYGGHDDRIMSLGFVISSFYKWDTNYWRASKVMAYSGKNPAHAAYDRTLLLSSSTQQPLGPLHPSAGEHRKQPTRQYAQWAYNDQSVAGDLK